VSEKMALKRIFGEKRLKITGDAENYKTCGAFKFNFHQIKMMLKAVHLEGTG
jgi:hypothetical protein